MRWSMLSLLAVLGTVLVCPAVAGAQEDRDSVQLFGTANVADASGSTTTVTTLTATSGPSGEAPTGAVDFNVNNIHVFGQVTCLNVDGNMATINFRDQGTLFGFILTVQVVDGDPDTFEYGPIDRAPDDCSPFESVGGGGPLTSGDIVVHDALPLPVSKDQCKHGGWRNFPQFENQGQCVAFVQGGP